MKQSRQNTNLDNLDQFEPVLTSLYQFESVWINLDQFGLPILGSILTQ